MDESRPGFKPGRLPHDRTGAVALKDFPIKKEDLLVRATGSDDEITSKKGKRICADGYD